MPEGDGRAVELSEEGIETNLITPLEAELGGAGYSSRAFAVAAPGEADDAAGVGLG